ncbi:hypothetical protein H4218_002649 [Coemansia sp. IMI 209128]|nr:hypothetical protein H4218_002649 [Coemansia sp. IMI 209128]
MTLFNNRDEELVKKFLFNKIEKESDADPAIMTDYIVVTLQNEMNEAELKEHCLTDLAEFFGDRTLVFVNSLFDALNRKLYLPHTSSNLAIASDQHQRRSGGGGGSENGHSNRRRSRSPDNSRVRERERDRRGRSSRSPSRDRMRMPARDAGYAGNDMALLNGPLEPAGGNNAMFAAVQEQQQQQPMQRRRKPCFEFMRRGACQRGDSCSYAHVTPEQAQMMGMAAGPGPGFGQLGPRVGGGNGGPFMMAPQMNAPQGFFPMGMRPPGMHMQGQGGIRPNNGPGNYDNNQPMSSTAVFVTNIPDEAMSEGSVSEFFSRFGAIQDIRIDFARHSAVVEFGDSSAQAQALGTPEAIFNNRFVRVHKARLQHSAALSTSHDNSQRQAVQSQQPQPPVWRPKSATIKKAEMIEKFVEQQKELMKKLTTTKDMPPATRKIIMDSINQIQKKIDDIRRPKPTPDADAAEAPVAEEAGAVETEKQALQAKLKALQVETSRLSASAAARGGRGGGRGGMRPAHHGSMSLDKRPRTLVLRNVGQSAAERLDSEMAQFGEIEHIDKTEDRNDPPFTYAVKFKARWEAEAAMKAVTSLDSFSDVSVDWDQ